MSMHRGRFLLALTLCAGHALAAPAAGDGAALTRAQRALDLSEADIALIASAVPAGIDFSRLERPGFMERTGWVGVRVKDRPAMARQVVAEQARLRAAPRPAADLAPMVEARIDRARARLAPSLLTTWAEVDEHRLQVPAGMTEEQFAEVLMATGDYDEVWPDWLVFPTATPNDPQFATNQYHHGANHLNTVTAWDYVTGDFTTIIATCDTGLRMTHQDIAANFIDGYNAVDRLTLAEGGAVDDINGHGTGATGCAAAIGNNGVGVAGMGWNFGILHARVTNSTGGGANINDIRRGIRWAADNGAVGISASYSGVTGAGNVGTYCNDAGAQLFWSSGNDGVQLDGPVADEIVVVGACGSNGQYASWSNWGDQVDIIAHGVSVRSTSRSSNTAYTWFGGTSAAAPLVNGAAGLLHSANPDLTPAQVRSILYETATDLLTPGYDVYAGWGRLNAGSAVIAALTGDFTTPLPFADDFEGGPLSMGLWAGVSGALVNGDAVGETSGANALNLGDNDTLRTVRLAGDGAPADLGVGFMLQTAGVETADALRVEYFNGTSWSLLFDHATDGQNTPEFGWVGASIPAPAHTDELRIRLTGLGDDAGDQWYIDDVFVGSLPAAVAPLRESFESAPSDVLWPAFAAARTTDDAATGLWAARVTGSGTLETGPIDTTGLMGAPAYVSVQVADEGADAGESLLVQVRDASMAWQTIASLVSDGTPDSGFSLVQAEMDLTWIHDAFAVRLAAQGNEPADAWLIDNLYVGPTSLDTACSLADIDANGTLNLDDVDAFITAFLGGDLIADVDGNGTLTLDDVDAFIAAFLVGCP